MTLSVAHASELKGLATYTHLNEPLYIAGIYAEAGKTTPQQWTDAEGNRVMEFRFVAERVSPRTFARVFLERVLGNNPNGGADSYQQEMQRLLPFVRQEFQRGDNLKFIAQADNTRLLINGVEQARFSRPGLFNLILNAWIGERLSGQTFYRDLTSPVKDELLAQYNVLIASGERQNWAEQLASSEGDKTPTQVADNSSASSAKKSTAKVATPVEPPVTKSTQVVDTKKSESRATEKKAATKRNNEAKASNTRNTASQKPVEKKETPKPQPKKEVAETKPEPRASQPPAAKKNASELSPLLQDLLDDYLAELKSSIENKASPRPPRTVRKVSKVDLIANVSVDQNGKVTSVSFVGDEFDDAILAAVTEELQRLTTLPKAPDVLPLDTYQVTTKFNFGKCKRPTSVWICF
ncbi:chalcone isomerase family protein [Pleionea litopenaei]|uniref:Chalcone isomerase family protein n=1 Tax=Pleionea litopenaei TaxID=3070815 RepID=A0AA51RSU9_9GAMM|nr:chalcone isomerase family protein [Pleionea sp. HL-JVS1]WMS86955.1 chalcone isomerase family protein [Pleionea sp. HL-JVS1]